jgi:hypothetical protein
VLNFRARHQLEGHHAVINNSVFTAGDNAFVLSIEAYLGDGILAMNCQQKKDGPQAIPNFSKRVKGIEPSTFTLAT